MSDEDRGGFLQDLPQEASMCYVDIDRQRVTIPEDLPEFPNQIQFLREIQEAFKQFNVPIEVKSNDVPFGCAVGARVGYEVNSVNLQ